MASRPAFPPLVRLPQETERLRKVVGIDAGTRVNPGVRGREANQTGHQTAFPQHKGWGVLATGGMPSGFRETPHKPFEVMSGARPEGWRDELQQLGHKRQSARRNRGDQAQPCGMRTTLLPAPPTRHDRRWRRLTARFGVQEGRQRRPPRKASLEWRTCLLTCTHDGHQAPQPFQEG
jgi:hypothetical protein